MYDNSSTTAVPVGAPSRQNRIMELLMKSRETHGLFVKQGEVVEGTVVEKRGSSLFVDLGPRGMGIVYGREYYAAQDIIKRLSTGDTMSAKVVEPDNEEGYVELSLKEAGDEKKWLTLRRFMNEGEVLELPVLEANRGGLILEALSVRGFLPASQLAPQNYPRVEGGDKERILVELQKLVGEKLKVKVLDVNQAEGKLIFTERRQVSEEMKQFLATHAIGDTVEGEIVSVVDFGAFMKIAETDLEGLIHISEIDWSLVEDPREILKTGDRVQAKIIDVQGDRISLSLKQLKDDPWVVFGESHKKGDTVTGRVTKLNPFGAFVELAKGVHGLVHVSEFGTEAHMREVLAPGSEGSFLILLIDSKEHKMSLGLPAGGQEILSEATDAAVAEETPATSGE